MNKAIKWLFSLLEAAVVACMVAMVVMVFGNVVLRYGFNSGISQSDELSRYCFIWMTYIGAILAMKEGGHLGVDTFVKKLPRLGKKIALASSELLMFFCNVLFFWGTWQMHELHVTNISPVVGLSMIWVYGIGYVTSVMIGIMNIHTLYRLISGNLNESELVQIRENEESIAEENAEGTVKG